MKFGKKLFQKSYCHTCHIRVAAFSPLPSSCVSLLNTGKHKTFGHVVKATLQFLNFSKLELRSWIFPDTEYFEKKTSNRIYSMEQTFTVCFTSVCPNFAGVPETMCRSSLWIIRYATKYQLNWPLEEYSTSD